MHRHSIIIRIMGMVAGAFLLTAAAVLFLTHFQIRTIIDSSQNAVYEARLGTVIKTLVRRDERLKATQMRAAYEEAFHAAALDDLRQTYYASPDQHTYPLIFDETGGVVLHPTLPRGDRSLAAAPYVQQLTERLDGSLNYRDRSGEPRWCIFHHFPQWDWIVVYTVPRDAKYADAQRLRSSLAWTMSIIVVLAMFVLAAVIVRIVYPIQLLIGATKAMEEGNPEQSIDTSGRDEIGTLARSFDAMRTAIREKINALTESEERFRALIDQAADAIFVHDHQGRLLDANLAACQSLGYSYAELMTLSVEHVDVGFGSHEQAVKQWKELRANKPLTVAVSHRRKDGSLFPVEVRLGVLKLRGRDVILALARDITERVQSTEALKKSELLFRLLAQVSPVGIFRTDAGGNCLYVNEKWCALAGTTRDSALRHGWERAIHPEDRPRVVEAMNHCVRDASPFVDEFRFIRADGKELWLYGQAMAEIDEDGDIQGMVGTITDITSRKDLEGQLRQAQKMEAIGTLAGGIAHDFNNLLTPIVGYAEMVQLDLPDGSETWQDQQEVLNAANRATDLIKQILSFSRQSKHELKPLSLHAVVTEALKLLRASIPATIEIHDDIDVDSGEILGDATQLQQVLMNLCTNSSHAMREEGGILTVALQQAVIGDDDSMVGGCKIPPGLYLLLEISDTGCGIAPATLDRIFEPYFTTKPSGEGTGMGLAMVHGIIKSHGGHIAVASTPGKGSTFQIYFPHTVAPATATRSATPSALAAGHERILVVDDEQVIVRMERQILGRLGYRVTAALGSEEALCIFTVDPLAFDLVITDMTMPRMDGAELSRNLLSIRPDIPIIMYTGYSDTCDAQRAKEIGLRAYVMKPIVRRELIQVVRTVLDARGARGVDR